MTVIAYRDGTLAADTLVTTGSDMAGQALKIKRLETWLVGYAGSFGSMQPVLNWITDGADFTKPVEYPAGMDTSAILIDKDGQGHYVDSESRFVSKVTAPYMTIGCGSSGARVAMHLGCSAIEAVEAVIDLDVACGGKVTFLTVEGEGDLTLLE